METIPALFFFHEDLCAWLQYLMCLAGEANGMLFSPRDFSKMLIIPSQEQFGKYVLLRGGIQE